MSGVVLQLPPKEDREGKRLVHWIVLILLLVYFSDLEQQKEILNVLICLTQMLMR